MTVRARIDIDTVYHDASDTSLTIGNLAEHLSPALTSAQTISASVGNNWARRAATRTRSPTRRRSCQPVHSQPTPAKARIPRK
jgi:hypothetical protein